MAVGEMQIVIKVSVAGYLEGQSMRRHQFGRRDNAADVAATDINAAGKAFALGDGDGFDSCGHEQDSVFPAQYATKSGSGRRHIPVKSHCDTAVDIAVIDFRV